MQTHSKQASPIEPMVRMRRFPFSPTPRSQATRGNMYLCSNRSQTHSRKAAGIPPCHTHNILPSSDTAGPAFPRTSTDTGQEQSRNTNIRPVPEAPPSAAAIPCPLAVSVPCRFYTARLGWQPAIDAGKCLTGRRHDFRVRIGPGSGEARNPDKEQGYEIKAIGSLVARPMRRLLSLLRLCPIRNVRVNPSADAFRDVSTSHRWRQARELPRTTIPPS